MTMAGRCSRTIFDDLIRGNRIASNNLVRLVVKGVGIDASVGAGDQLLFNSSILDEDIGSNHSSSLLFLTSSVVSNLFLLDTTF